MENQLFLGMAEMKYGASNSLSKEQDPDALEVYNRLLNYCKRSPLTDVMDVLQTRATIA